MDDFIQGILIEKFEDRDLTLIQESLFRDVVIHPRSDDSIDVLVAKVPKGPFKVLGSPSNLQVILQWMWDLGKKREIDANKQASTHSFLPFYSEDRG